MDSDSVWVRAVPWARESLEAGLIPERKRLPRAELPPEFEEKRGAFVTLKRHPSGALRGCIGYPLPILPLRLAVARAALAAATDDPRFRPVVAEELSRITVEVSVLSVPEPISSTQPAERVAAVQVGRDGLIVEGFGTSGLLLPQVAPEQRWNAEEFLEGACQKAGLPFDAWRDPRLRILRFGADVFAEKSPGGEVVRVPTGD